MIKAVDNNYIFWNCTLHTLNDDFEFQMNEVKLFSSIVNYFCLSSLRINIWQSGNNLLNYYSLFYVYVCRIIIDIQSYDFLKCIINNIRIYSNKFYLQFLTRDICLNLMNFKVQCKQCFAQFAISPLLCAQIWNNVQSSYYNQLTFYLMWYEI